MAETHSTQHIKAKKCGRVPTPVKFFWKVSKSFLFLGSARKNPNKVQLIAKHFLKRNEAAIVENLKFMAERRKIKCETLIGQIFILSNNKGAA